MHKRRAGTHEWVHPETICLDGIAHGDVPRDALVVAQLAEDAEGLREAELEERALLELRLVGVGKDTRAREVHRRLARGRPDVDVAVGVDVGGRLLLIVLWLCGKREGGDGGCGGGGDWRHRSTLLCVTCSLSTTLYDAERRKERRHTFPQPLSDLNTLNRSRGHEFSPPAIRVPPSEISSHRAF